MEPGRELDALVAEKVMGLDGVGYYKRESCHTSQWTPAVEGETTDDCPAWTASLYYLPGASEYGKPTALALSARLSPFALPRYSTDIAAAWEVVEKMKECPDARFRALRLVAYPYNRTYATFDADEDPDDWSEGNGDHATEWAICLAVLKACDSTG